MTTKLADLRLDYSLQSLDITDVAADPFQQFEKWLDDALKSQLLEPNAMILATATPDARPSARVVLLKGMGTEGFYFYTNYDSRKGAELAANPQAALCFNWLDLQRQVRIEGLVKKTSAAQSDAYFQTRPLKSQIGALASPQSQVIPNRGFLEENFLKVESNTEGSLERPAHWGGYVLEPTLIEFWQGRRSRLHDRIQYSKMENGDWKIERLAP